MKLSVAEKNDKFRTKLSGYKIVLTNKVLSSEIRENILASVQTFNEFTPENDPHDEHDCAFFLVAQQAYFFKFDYYDQNYELFEEDGLRVLTIGHHSEY